MKRLTLGIVVVLAGVAVALSANARASSTAKAILPTRHGVYPPGTWIKGPCWVSGTIFRPDLEPDGTYSEKFIGWQAQDVYDAEVNGGSQPFDASPVTGACRAAQDDVNLPFELQTPDPYTYTVTTEVQTWTVKDHNVTGTIRTKITHAKLSFRTVDPTNSCAAELVQGTIGDYVETADGAANLSAPAVILRDSPLLRGVTTAKLVNKHMKLTIAPHAVVALGSVGGTRVPCTQAKAPLDLYSGTVTLEIDRTSTAPAPFVGTADAYTMRVVGDRGTFTAVESTKRGAPTVACSLRGQLLFATDFGDQAKTVPAGWRITATYDRKIKPPKSPYVLTLAQGGC